MSDFSVTNAQTGQNIVRALNTIATKLNYQLPIATTAELGGIIVGANLAINAAGTLSATSAGSGNIPAGNTNELLGASGTSGTANLIVLGGGVTLTAGTLSAGGGSGSVTEVVAGTGLGGGTITSTGTITLEPASATVLGGVIPGAGLAVNAGGTLSNTGVLTITAGAGISVTGTDTINNTGVLSLGTIVPGTAIGSLLGTTGTLNDASAVAVGANLTLALGTLSAANPGTGTVTSVVAGAGLSGGTVTGSGTIALGTVAAGDLLANTSTVSAVPSAVAPSALFDDAFGAVQGDVLYRGASGWVVLAPGSAGQALESGGAAANPAWKTSIPAGTTLDLLGASGTLGVGVAVVVGTGLEMASETLSNSGVLALGGTAGSITLGTNLSITGGTLNAAGGGSTTIDTGAGLVGGPISTSGTIYAATPVTSTYTASGTIAVSDVLSLVNAASAAAMTLAAGAVDGHVITVKRFGAGTVSVAATIDGASETVEMASSTVKECVSLTWNAGNSTWLLF